jgi:hypothetical protein
MPLPRETQGLHCAGHLCSTLQFSQVVDLSASPQVVAPLKASQAQHRTWHLSGVITVIPWFRDWFWDPPHPMDAKT